MILNAETVKGFGLAVPSSILLRADEVIDERIAVRPVWINSAASVAPRARRLDPHSRR
jgi:hypothetical protein